MGWPRSEAARVLAVAALPWRALARAVVAVSASGMLWPAAAGAHWPPTVTEQRSHAQCPLGGDEAQVLLLDAGSSFTAWLGRDESTVLGRTVDWRRERVLVVAMARQPTAGIAIGLESAVPHVGRREIRATARVTRPAPGDMAATVLTRPCVVATIPRGAWRLVSVDLEGRAMAARRVRAGDRPAQGPAQGPGGTHLVPMPLR